MRKFNQNDKHKMEVEMLADPEAAPPRGRLDVSWLAVLPRHHIPRWEAPELLTSIHRAEELTELPIDDPGVRDR